MFAERVDAANSSMENQESESFYRTAASMYQPGFGAEFTVEQAAESSSRYYEILRELETFSQAAGNILSFLNYHDALPQRSSEDSLELVSSAFFKKCQLRVKKETKALYFQHLLGR